MNSLLDQPLGTLGSFLNRKNPTFVICPSCGFYCYSDEWVCPNCDHADVQFEAAPPALQADYLCKREQHQKSTAFWHQTSFASRCFFAFLCAFLFIYFGPFLLFDAVTRPSYLYSALNLESALLYLILYRTLKGYLTEHPGRTSRYLFSGFGIGLALFLTLHKSFRLLPDYFTQYYVGGAFGQEVSVEPRISLFYVFGMLFYAVSLLLNIYFLPNLTPPLLLAVVYQLSFWLSFFPLTITFLSRVWSDGRPSLETRMRDFSSPNFTPPDQKGAWVREHLSILHELINNTPQLMYLLIGFVISIFAIISVSIHGAVSTLDDYRYEQAIIQQNPHALAREFVDSISAKEFDAALARSQGITIDELGRLAPYAVSNRIDTTRSDKQSFSLSRGSKFGTAHATSTFYTLRPTQSGLIIYLEMHQYQWYVSSVSVLERGTEYKGGW